MVSIQEIHTQSLGSEDIFRPEVLSEYPQVATIQRTHAISIPPGQKRIVLCSVLEPSILEGGGGINNLKITGDWTCARFLVGEKEFETIHHFMDQDTFSCTEGDRAFPLYSLNSLCVLIEAGPGGATLTFNAVTLEKCRSAMDLFTITNQYSGETTLKQGDTMVPLDFKHPVFVLYVKTSKPVNRLWLTLDTRELDAQFVWEPAKGRWVCTFQPITDPLVADSTLNFSRIYNPVLHVEHDHDSVVVTPWVATTTITRIMSGIASLVFAT